MRLTATRPAGGLADLYPGYFSLVMATGIVSIASSLLGWTPIAWALFAVNLIAYPALWALMLGRIVRWPRAVLADLVDHKRGPGFFTWIAGTAVLGNQFVLQAGLPAVGAALGLLAVALWVVVTYTFFVAVVVSSNKRDVEEALSGGWLLAAVATQSLAVLSTLLAPFVASSDVLLLAAVVFYLLGSMQYLLLIGPIFHRLVFLRLSAETWTPLFWINSGALSITTLAGSRLILSADRFAFLGEIEPFLKGFTLFFWAAATWWIPLLLLVGVWRHALKRFPLAYVPEYWGLVFPLGMYTACTVQLVQATRLEPLLAIAQLAVVLALAAWLLTAFGLVRHLVRLVRPIAAQARP